MSKSKFNKGVYIVINKEKYIGKHLPIFRSDWERVYCKRLDLNPSVVKWASEAVKIPYYDPVTQKMRNYYPDFFVQTSDGKKIIVEIKPLRETKKPRNSKNKKKSTIIYEQKTYSTNMAKWRYAIEFCKKRGLEFKIITEKNLGI